MVTAVSPAAGTGEMALRMQELELKRQELERLKLKDAEDRELRLRELALREREQKVTICCVSLDCRRNNTVINFLLQLNNLMRLIPCLAAVSRACLTTTSIVGKLIQGMT